STEWPDLPGAYAELVHVFPRAAVSDIAWARTSRWRTLLAGLWPDIAEVSRIRVRGTAAQAHLLTGWLRSRLDRKIELQHEPADTFEKAFRIWRRFDPRRASARTWLCQIARTTALDHFRAERRRRRREESFALQELRENESGFGEGLSPLLEAALAELSAAERE